jgi:RHS repeat-associated protein
VAHASRDSGGTLHTGQVSSSTSYDALGRRIVKTVTGTGQWDGTLNYYLDGNSVVEEQNGSAMTVKQFIWGNQYIDDLIQVSLNSSPSTQSTCDTPYWGMCDANWNVLGIVNSSGVLTERYEYTAYGERTTYFSAGTNDPACYTSTDATSQRFVTSGSVTQFYGICEVGFQGLMHDEESGLIFSRTRNDDTLLERFMEQDRLGYLGGNDLYEDERSNPITRVDPTGLLDSVQVALAEAIAEGDVATIQTILESAADELSEAEIQAAKAFLAKVAKCEAVYNAYKAAGANCRKCNQNTTPAQAAINAACFAAEVAGRAAYLAMDCGDVLAGSIKAGSAAQKANHATELANKTAALAACTARAACSK